MDKFLETYNLLRLSQEKQKIWTHQKQITIQFRNWNIPAIFWTGWLNSGFNKTFMEELTSTLSKLFWKIRKDERLPSSFYKVSIVLIPKPAKDVTYKRSYSLIAMMKIDAKSLNKILANQIHNTLKRSYIIIKWDLFLRCKVGSMFSNQHDTSHKKWCIKIM